MKVFNNRKKINICILGGGNIGTLLLGDLGTCEDVSVRLYTSKPDKWKNNIEVWSDNSIEHVGRIDRISNNPSYVISDSDIIISTLPSHVFPNVIEDIKKFIKPETVIAIMPGSGGAEFFCKDLIKNGNTILGFQRVYAIARIKEYGKSVYNLGRKKEVYIATIPSNKAKHISEMFEKIFNFKCNYLPSYLNVTLTPSNPILHTTRLYNLFNSYKKGVYWEKKIKFYEEWNDSSSQLLISCDNELQNICKNIKGIDLTNVKSLKEHYESKDVKEMTNKIKNIKAFKGIEAPMKYTTNGYIPDLDSRYFVEDFTYGLFIIKGFGKILNVDTPSIDEVIKFYERISGIKIDKIMNTLPVPSNFGIKTLEDIVLYYK